MSGTRLGDLARFWADGSEVADLLLARLDLAGHEDVLIAGWRHDRRVVAHRLEVAPAGNIFPNCGLRADVSGWSRVPAAVVSLFGRRCCLCSWPSVEPRRRAIDHSIIEGTSVGDMRHPVGLRPAAHLTNHSEGAPEEPT